MLSHSTNSRADESTFVPIFPVYRPYWISVSKLCCRPACRNASTKLVFCGLLSTIDHSGSSIGSLSFSLTLRFFHPARLSMCVPSCETKVLESASLTFVASSGSMTKALFHHHLRRCQGQPLLGRLMRQHPHLRKSGALDPRLQDKIDVQDREFARVIDTRN